MNAYTVIAIALFVSFIVLNILRGKFPNRKLELCLVDSALSVCGVILIIVSLILISCSFSSDDTEFVQWLRDMATVFFRVDLPVFAVLIFVIFVPAFLAWADKKQRSGFGYTVRQISVVFASAFMLIIGGFYSVVIANGTVASAVHIRLFVIGEALVFRAVNAVEYRSYLLEKENVKKK